MEGFLRVRVEGKGPNDLRILPDQKTLQQSKTIGLFRFVCGGERFLSMQMRDWFREGSPFRDSGGLGFISSLRSRGGRRRGKLDGAIPNKVAFGATMKTSIREMFVYQQRLLKYLAIIDGYVYGRGKRVG